MKALFVGPKDARADYRRTLEKASAGQQLPLEHVIYFGEDSWREMMARGSDFVSPALSCQDVVNIQYTSGTTGSPKGVLLTHRDILNNANLGVRCMNVSERDRICVPVPMYHCFGCVAAQ